MISKTSGFCIVALRFNEGLHLSFYINPVQSEFETFIRLNFMLQGQMKPVVGKVSHGSHSVNRFTPAACPMF